MNHTTTLKKSASLSAFLLFLLLCSSNLFAQIPVNGSTYKWTGAAASVSSASFSYLAPGTYTPLSGGVVLGTSANNEQHWNGNATVATTGSAIGFPIGFPFTFNGTTFTRFSVNTNGWVRLQPSTAVANVSTHTPISAGGVSGANAKDLIAGLARDLEGQAGASLRYVSTPTSLTIQWENYKAFDLIGAGDLYNFQIVIRSTGEIEVNYGPFVKGLTNQLVQVGIKGANNTIYNNRSIPVGGSWSASLAGTANNATAALQIPPNVAPINDLCINAILITCPYSVTGNTEFATNDFMTDQCSAGVGTQTAPGVWYKIQGTGQIFTISLCNSGYDTRLSVYKNTCSSDSCVTGNDDTGIALCALQSEVTFASQVGVEYYILIHGFSFSAGYYLMNVTCATACVPLNPNDECNLATPLTLGPANSTAYIIGNNECATISPNGNPTTPGCGGAFAAFTDVWYSFTSGGESSIILDLSTLGVPNPMITGPYYYSLYTTCTAFSGFCGSITINTPASVACAPNTNYILRLYNSSNDPSPGTLGNYGILVALPPPTNVPPEIFMGSIGPCFPSGASAIAAALANTTATAVCPGSITFAGVVSGPLCAATVTVTATDACGNAASVNYSTRIDNVGPVFTGCPTDVSYNCYDAVPSLASIIVTANDQCDGSVAVTASEVATNGVGSCNNTIVRTWTAVDNCGNTSTCTQFITISNTVVPEFSSYPADITVQCLSAVPANPNLTATDDCDGSVAVVYNQTISNGSNNCGNVVTRTWNSYDNCGNNATWTQVITVGDQTPPLMTCPANITTCGPNVNLGSPIVSDNCGTVSLSNNAPSSFPNGTTIVTWTAVDGCGNMSTCQQTVNRSNPMTVSVNPVPVTSGVRSCGWGFNTHIITRVTTRQNAILQPVITGGTPPFTYQWSGSNLSRLSSTTVLNPVYTPVENAMSCYEDCYFLTVTDASGFCSVISVNPVCIRVQMGAAGAYGDAGCQNNPNKVTICHMPPGNPTNVQYICVSINAIPAHSFGPDVGPTSLSHKFDCIGSCNQLACGVVPKSVSFQEEMLNEDITSGMILENFPDPFKEMTTVRFVMDHDSHAKMEVFDLSGKMVRLLFEGDVKAHQDNKFQLDGSDLQSGLYIYKLTTPEAVHTGKMMLMKN